MIRSNYPQMPRTNQGFDILWYSQIYFVAEKCYWNLMFPNIFVHVYIYIHRIISDDMWKNVNPSIYSPSNTWYVFDIPLVIHVADQIYLLDPIIFHWSGYRDLIATGMMVGIRGFSPIFHNDHQYSIIISYTKMDVIFLSSIFHKYRPYSTIISLVN